MDTRSESSKRSHQLVKQANAAIQRAREAVQRTRELASKRLNQDHLRLENIGVGSNRAIGVRAEGHFNEGASPRNTRFGNFSI